MWVAVAESAAPGDSMFLELPDLPTATFPSLQELTYDGPVSQQVNPCSFHVSTGLF